MFPITRGWGLAALQYLAGSSDGLNLVGFGKLFGYLCEVKCIGKTKSPNSAFGGYGVGRVSKAEQCVRSAHDWFGRDPALHTLQHCTRCNIADFATLHTMHY